MRILLSCTLSLAAWCAVAVSAEQSTNSPGLAAPAVVFHFPSSFDTTGLKITYGMAGAFGGVVGVIRGAPKIHDYPFETAYLGKPATSLKGYAYRTGYGVEFFRVDLPASRSSRTIALELKPLGTVRIAGHVQLPEGRSPDGLRLAVSYSPSWQCEFFGELDCMVGEERMEATPLPVDGSFAFDVPDFWRDAGLTRFESKGGFSLRVVDASGHTAFTWETEDSADNVLRTAGLYSLPVAASYPADLRLIAKVPPSF
jgi:hypothetical protein